MKSVPNSITYFYFYYKGTFNFM